MWYSMVKRLTKWDMEILERITSDRPKFASKAIRTAYRERRKAGLSPEEILDEMSGQTADTRWIYWLKSAPKTEKQLKKVI